MGSEGLMGEILSSLEPDARDSRWSQVNRFGGGMGIEYEVGELIYAIVRTIKPEIVIETGTFKGFSTLMIARALKENKWGYIHSIDIKDLGVQQEVDRYGFRDRVSLHNGNSPDVIRKIAKALTRVDLLWLDSDHSVEHVLEEMKAAEPLLHKGAYVAFHDTLSDSREDKAISAIRREHPEWEYIRFMSSRGFDLMRIP